MRHVHPKMILQVLRLALPIALARMLEVSMATVDTIMVGHLGKDALACVGIGLPLFNVLAVFFMGTLLAVAPMLGRIYKRADLVEIKRVLLSAKLLSLAFAMVVGAIFFFSDRLFYALGQPTDLVPGARRFLLIILAGVPALFLNQSLRQVFEVYKRAKVTVAIAAIAFVLNIFGNWVLIHGRLGFPALGIYGSAISTAVCWWWMSAAHVFMLRFIEAPVNFTGLASPLPDRRSRIRFPPLTSLRSWLSRSPSSGHGQTIHEATRAPTIDYRKIIFSIEGPKLPDVRRFLAQGLPFGSAMVAEVAFFVVSAWMIGRLGKLPLASHHISINLASLTFMVAIGTSHATTVLISQVHGAYRKARMFVVGASGTIVITAFMSVTAFLFIAFPRFFVRFYTTDAEILAFAPKLLVLGGVFQLCDGIQSVFFGILRGMGAPKAALVNTLVSYWVLGMPMGYLLGSRLGVGAQGYWIGLNVGLTAASVLHYAAIRRGFAASAAMPPVPGMARAS